MSILYFKLVASALAGIVFAILMKMRAMNAKTSITGEKTTLLKFLQDDFTSILGTLTAVIIILLPLSEILNPDALIIVNPTFTFWIFQFTARAILNFVLISAMGFAGHSGMDVVLKIYSVANREANKKLENFTPDNKS